MSDHAAGPADRARRSGQGLTTVVMFLLVPQVKLRKRLDDRHQVLVLDPRERFTFIPSLIWLPFGLREADERVEIRAVAVEIRALPVKDVRDLVVEPRLVTELECHSLIARQDAPRRRAVVRQRRGRHG